MAATLTSTLNVALKALLQNPVGLAAVNGQVDYGGPLAIPSGIGVGQCDKIFSESQKSIAGNYDVDLAGVLTDIFGATITFARVKLLCLFAAAANPGNIIIGNAAANQWPGPFGAVAQTVAVRPGGLLVMYAPDATAWPVTPATGDILRLAPSSGTCIFDWAVLGASV